MESSMMNPRYLSQHNTKVISILVLIMILPSILSFIAFSSDPKEAKMIHLPNNAEKEIHQLVVSGRKPEAIKRVRELTGAGLKVSGDYVDALVERMQLTQPENTWIKRSPLPDAVPSPRLGYEGACVWDSKHHVLIRYGGHNQGGGGEQHSEVWTFDPITTEWILKEPNTSPPGVCCAQQNVFDTVGGSYIRFPAFSGSHGWQWFREIYMNNSSVWSYDLSANTWRDLRPLPEPHIRPLRCAAWDSDHQVIVVFGGEGGRDVYQTA